jgi:sn-glycerol 3-phosphate transport system substrate-binding protein
MKTRLSTLLLFLMASGFTWAQPVQIEVWHSLSSSFGAPQIESFIAQFNEEQSEIEVNLVYAGGYTDALVKGQAAVAAGVAPNVSMFEQTRGAGFVDAGAILSLNDRLDSTPDLSLDNFFERLLATCDYDGTLYCIPYNTSTPVLYYNKDLFAEAGLDPEAPPTTWDEYLRFGDAISQLGDDRWGIGVTTRPGWLFDAFLGQAGGRYLNEDGAFAFNGQPALDMLAFWQQIIDSGAGKASTSQTEDFFNGNQAMLLASTAQLTNYFGRATFDLGVGQLPCNVECYAPIGGANFYLLDTGTDEQKDAAWTFLTWLIKPERLAEFAVATGYMAAQKSALETPLLMERLAELPAARVTYDQMESHGYPRTLVPFWGEVHAQLTLIAEEVLLGGADPQATLDSAVEEANRLLEVYAE